MIPWSNDKYLPLKARSENPANWDSSGVHFAISVAFLVHLMEPSNYEHK